MLRVLLFVLIAVGAASCSSDIAKKEVLKAPGQPVQPVASTNPETVVQQFLTWYRKPKGESLDSLSLIPACLTVGDTTDFYRVDFKVAEQYLSSFRSSGFVSDNYLSNELKVIQQADSIMEAEPVNDGPPRGLDYDRIVFSQDPDADLEKLLRTKPTVNIRGDTARAYFAQLPKPEDLREGGDLEFLLVRQKGRWVIEEIRPVFKQE